MNHGALANLDHDEAINEIASGVMLKEIAARHNVSKVAVYKRLKEHPDYKDAIALQADSFVQDAMEEVRTCDNENVNIARARVDAAFKYAKAHNKDYADKQQVEHTGNVSVEHVVKTDLDSLVSRNNLGASMGASQGIDDAIVVNSQADSASVRLLVEQPHYQSE